MADVILYGQKGGGEKKQILPSFTGTANIVQVDAEKGYAELTTSGTLTWMEGPNSDPIKLPYKKPSSIDVFILGGGGGASGTAGAVKGYSADGTSIVLPVKIAHGAGGGSGNMKKLLEIAPKDSVSVVVGTGGAPGANGYMSHSYSWSIASNPTAGSDGGSSSYDGIIAEGGKGGGLAATLSAGGSTYEPELTPLPAKGGDGASGGGPGAWILAGVNWTAVKDSNPNGSTVGGNGGANGSDGTLAEPNSQSGAVGTGSGQDTYFLGKQYANGGNGGGVAVGSTGKTGYGDGGDGAILGITKVQSGPSSYQYYYDWNKIGNPSAGTPGIVVVRWGKWD